LRHRHSLWCPADSLSEALERREDRGTLTCTPALDEPAQRPQRSFHSGEREEQHDTGATERGDSGELDRPSGSVQDDRRHERNHRQGAEVDDALQDRGTKHQR
jgi:hypothetical protein